MSPWIVVLVAGAGSFALRISLVALVDHVGSPEWLERVASYIVPAAFAGLAVTALARPVRVGGTHALAPLVAVAVTGAVARRHPTHLAFVAGLVALWATTALTSA